MKDSLGDLVRRKGAAAAASVSDAILLPVRLRRRSERICSILVLHLRGDDRYSG